MNIGILGAGVIGQTLGKKWAAAGHDIVFGVRRVENPALNRFREELVAFPSSTTIDTTQAAIAHGDVILFAIPGAAVAGVAARFANALNGKIIIDAANRIGQPTLNSIAEIRESCPTAQVYRAFNALGWENFAEPNLAGHTLDLFYAGPEGPSNQSMDNLIHDIGLRPVYLGGYAQIEAADGAARLWFALVFGRGYGRRLGFKVVRAES